MARYRGHKGGGGVGSASVTKNGITLLPDDSLKLRNHSPGGFEWGYLGSGPAQLALALLLDVTGDGEIAQAHYQDFKSEVVCGWVNSWEITTEEIQQWIAASEELKQVRAAMAGGTESEPAPVPEAAGPWKPMMCRECQKPFEDFGAVYLVYAGTYSAGDNTIDWEYKNPVERCWACHEGQNETPRQEG